MSKEENKVVQWMRKNHLLPDWKLATGFWGKFGEVMRTINHWCHRFILIIADVSLVAMVAIVFYTVVLRYCFNTGIGWAEEVPRLLVVLFAFMACAMGTRDHMHVSVNVLYNAFEKGSKPRVFMEYLTDVCVLICGWILMTNGYQYMARLMRVTGVLPMTGLRTWVQYIPMPITGFIMVFDSLLFLTGILKPDDLMYSEKETDYVEEAKKISREARA
ncbi:MAG: TRAP transporter small permease [Clostridia bacterium]|nr:TRAP transporter small permease [Clostridia bacterium]